MVTNDLLSLSLSLSLSCARTRTHARTHARARQIILAFAEWVVLVVNTVPLRYKELLRIHKRGNTIDINDDEYDAEYDDDDNDRGDAMMFELGSGTAVKVLNAVWMPITVIFVYLSVIAVRWFAELKVRLQARCRWCAFSGVAASLSTMPEPLYLSGCMLVTQFTFCELAARIDAQLSLRIH